jgi:hypothetical protein
LTDDNLVNQKLAVGVLQQQGHEVIVASDHTRGVVSIYLLVQDGKVHYSAIEGLNEIDS